jgi:hypothetical protein
MLSVNLFFLQKVPILCDYKVWIDHERGKDAKAHLRRMICLEMWEEEISEKRRAERERDEYFKARHEATTEEYQRRCEEERECKREHARHAKAAFEHGGEAELAKGKWYLPPQD